MVKLWNGEMGALESTELHFLLKRSLVSEQLGERGADT